MLGLRASARRIRGLFTPADDSRTGVDHVPSEAAAIITQTVYKRELAGHSTSLRQIHRLAELSQPDALRIVGALEKQGMLSIEADLHDALESRIVLTRPTRDRIAHILGPQTA